MLTGIWADKTPRYLHGRRRANSNSRAASPRPSTGHNRAGSEFSTTFLKETSDAGPLHGSHVGGRLPRPQVSPALGQNPNSVQPASSVVPRCEVAHEEPTLDTKDSAPQITLDASSPTSTAPTLEVVSTSPFSMQAPNGAGYSSQTSLPSEASSDRPARDPYPETYEDDDGRDPDDIPILDREGEMSDFEDDEKPVQNKGYTWDELVDRLLSQPMSRSDHNFVLIFLCFYRKFAPPRDLLNAIIDRFERAYREYPITLQRVSAHIRYCNILLQWVTIHPADFAYPRTRRRLMAFLKSISGNKGLRVLVGEMKNALTVEVEDEDGTWARADHDTEKRNSMESFLSDSCPESEVPLSLIAQGDYCVRVQTGGSLRLEVHGPGSEMDHSARRTSETARSFDSTSTSSSSQGFSMIQKEATNTTSIGTDPRYSRMLMTSSQYDLFMSIPVEEIAAELTRLDWDEFSEIKPRDLIRYISIPPEQREKSHSLKHINTIVSQFNHVAYWVASVILERPKAKHRAKVLEKFMEIAWVRVACFCSSVVLI